MELHSVDKARLSPLAYRHYQQLHEPLPPRFIVKLLHSAPLTCAKDLLAVVLANWNRSACHHHGTNYSEHPSEAPG